MIRRFYSLFISEPLKNITLLIFVFLVQTGCRSQTFTYSRITSYGTIKYTAHDSIIINDLIMVCDERLNDISNALRLRTDNSIIIEIFPDQQEYDKHIMNNELKGSPAISGNGRIQLVSPLSKIKIDTISYINRLLFLIHEYVHVLIDQVEPAPPIFIDEGLACYFGSYTFYHAIVEQNAEKFTFFPTIEQLKNHYEEIPAADVFSFLFIDFLLNSTDSLKVSSLLRNPDILESYNSKWIEFTRNKFLNDVEK